MAHVATPTTRQYHAAVGKRKTSSARVRLFPEGKGEVMINGLKISEYFSGIQIENAVSPLKVAGYTDPCDIAATVIGGGKSSQSDAVRHGLSRVLISIRPELRPSLKKAGFLRRDARIKERKKPGLKRARRAPQWQKR